MLKQRIITAAVLLPIVVAATLMLPNSYFILLSFVPLILIGGWEWGNLLLIKEQQKRFLFLGSLIVMATLSYFFNAHLFPTVIAAALLWWVIVLGLLATYRRETTFYMKRRWIFYMAAFVVLVPAWWFLGKLHKFNPQWVLYLILLIAIADTGAFFSGKRFGKRKLAPELSPGKTLEGVMGALVACLVWSALGALYFQVPGNHYIYFVLLSLLTVVFSIAGDLFISMIKREAGLKDSGSILPGHGGILDRTDSLLAALPIFTTGLVWAGLQGL